MTASTLPPLLSSDGHLEVRPERWTPRMPANLRDKAPRKPAMRSSRRERRPSRIRSRVAASVRPKNAKCTPNPSSSHAEGPLSSSSSAKCSLPSAVSW